MLRFFRRATVLFALLTAQAWAACTTQPIDFGETKSGVIAADDCQNNSNNTTFYYDSYFFSGVAGQKIAITMNTTSTLDPFIFFVSPDKTFISDNNSGGGLNARIPSSGFLTLTQTGTYEIQAVTAAALTTGSYTLSLTSSTPAACNVAANPQSSATLPLASGTPVAISAACGSGAAPITFTWDNGTFTGAVRNVTPTATTSFNIVASNANGSSPPFSVTVFVSAPAPGVPTVEFYNINLGHYFVTAVQAEATAIDNGSAGPGWVRTGFSYDVYNGPVTQGGISTAPVCRFYGTPGVGPNSHFYTVDANECAAVKKDPGWFYEGIAYHIQPPVNGACPTGTQPIFRAYNNRAAQNDSNHRFITNAATFQQMGDKGWNQEGLVMCTTSVRSPTPVLGGTFADPGGSGAVVAVAPGELPPYVNATQPQTAPTRQFPPGMVNTGSGETNVTKGAQGYDFNMTGDGSFSTTATGAVMIKVPFNTAGIPPADVTNPLKTFVRLHDPADATQVDINGDITVSGSSGLVAVNTQGLPSQFTASVIYNPSMDSLSSDEAVPGDTSEALPLKSATATSWPGQGWCVFYNAASPALIAAVQVALGIVTQPSLNDIKRVLKSKVLSSAVVAQTIYQNDNFGPPNMGTGTRICSPAKQRYFIHMMETNGKFVPDDDGAATNESTGIHYGRLYIGASRINSPITNPIGSILSVVAHEMLHSVQNGYRILGQTPKSYREGGATIYGKSIDNNQVITARPETTILSRELLDPVDKSPNRYGSEDFWAYVGKAYNGGKLEYLAGLYAQMRATLGPNTLNPSSGAMYGALDTYFKAKFSKSLQEIYLDFLKQRALTHNAASQFGRANEVTVGLAENLFAANAIAKRTIDVGNCAASKITLNGTFSPFSSPAIVITPTGSLPAGNTTGVTLTTKITTTSSSVGALWNGWTYRDNVATALADTNKFAGFGKSATDSVTLLIANLDPQNSSRFTLEVTCGGIKIDSLAPVRGKIGDVVTINGSGFGGASDVRKVTFNGVIATAVTWVSDSQLRATVPVNASTGSVIVTLGTEVSNGVSFEVVAACSAQQNAGTDVPDTRSIELGKTSGTFNFTYNTYTQKDRILVRYQNATVFDTGCVGMAATKSISYSGTQTFIVVEVQPNCEKPGSTSWDYSVSCP